MKNTKHTENLDNSTPQEITSQSKRKILTSIGVSSGILGASALSQQWTKPIVNSIILPAHAQTTGMMGTDAPGTDAPGTDAPGTDAPTTAAPTTDAPAPKAAIVLSPMAGGVVNASVDGGAMVSVAVRLATEPTGPVTVMAEGPNVTAAGSVSFTTTNWDQDKVVMLTISNVANPATMAAEKEAKVTFTATGNNYDEVEAEWMYTAGFYGMIPIAANDVTVKVTDRTAPGEATVTWDEPKTRAMVEEYKLTLTNADGAEVKIDGTMATVTKLPSGGGTVATFQVDVLYMGSNTTFMSGTPADADKVIVG